MITRLTIHAEEIYSGTTTAGAGSKLHFSLICTENCCIFLFIRLFIIESNVLICSSFQCETTSTANMHVSLCACVPACTRVCLCVCLWLLNALRFLTVVVNLIRVSLCYRHSCSKSGRLTLNTFCFLPSRSGTETMTWTLLKDHRPIRKKQANGAQTPDRKSEVCAASLENEHPGRPPGFSMKHHLHHHVIVQPLPCDAWCSISAAHYNDNIKSSATKKRLFSVESRTHAHHSPLLALLHSMPPLSETASNTDGHPANPGHLCTAGTRVFFTWWCFVGSYSLLHSGISKPYLSLI